MILDCPHKQHTLLQAIVISRDPQQRHYLRQGARSQALLRLQREATEAGIRADASVIDAKERERKTLYCTFCQTHFNALLACSKRRDKVCQSSKSLKS